MGLFWVSGSYRLWLPFSFISPFCSFLVGLSSIAQSSKWIFWARTRPGKQPLLSETRWRGCIELWFEFLLSKLSTTVIRKGGRRSLWNNKLSQTSYVLFSKVLRTFWQQKFAKNLSTSDSQQGNGFLCFYEHRKSGEDWQCSERPDKKNCRKGGKNKARTCSKFGTYCRKFGCVYHQSIEFLM